MANKELKSIKFEGLDDTYTLLTEEEVNTKLSEYAKTSEITQIDIQTVNALPETGVKGVIYLVPSSTLKMSNLLNNPLAVVQADTNSSTTFSVNKTTNIKAGMTLKFVSNSAMGEATVESVTASTKTVTLTIKATLAKGTLVFDSSKYGKDTCAEYIWNPSTNKFERLGLVDVNAVSTATPQTVVARDWNGRAQVENPSAAKDIANKDYVDSAVSDKITMGDLMGAIDGKLDSTALGNFTFDTNTLKNENTNAEIALGISTGMPDNTTISQKGIARSNIAHNNNGSWSILDGNVQAFSSDANPVMKEASLFDIINSSEKTNVINDSYGAVIKSDKLGLVNTFTGEAVTITKTNLEVLSNGETKSETLENIIDAPSKKQDKLVSGTNIKTINGESILGEGDITVTPTIDDTLSDTSTNAVQNKVVKEAIDGKLDKTTELQVVYVRNSAGVDTTLFYDYEANKSSVAVRDVKGVLKVGTPTADNHATTKKYVDDGFTNKLYEANLNWGGKDFASGYGILDAALIPTLGADRFRGITNTDAIIIQYSRDGGTTWLDYDASDKQKIGLFCDDYDPAPINIGKATTGTEITSDYKLRIIIDAYKAKIYTELRKFALYVSTNGSSGCTVTIDAAPADDTTTDEGTNDNYNKILKQDVPLAGWSGWNVINNFYFTLRNNNGSGHYRKVRFTFSITEQTNTNYVGFRVLCIKAFGGFGWNVPNYEAKYGFPFKLVPSGGYVCDKEFNFVKGLKVNYSPVATESYVTNNLSGKLDKNTSAQQVVYVNDSNSKPSFIKYTPEVTPYTMAYRGANGVLKVGTPTANEDATTKEYVDSKTVTVIDSVTSTSTTAALSANQGKMLKLAIDGKASSTDLSLIGQSVDIIKNDYDIISSSTWTYTGSSASATSDEPNKQKSHYISYGCPINPQAIENAKIVNPNTGATVATCTGQTALNANTYSTVYHFGDNYNIIIIEPQDGNIFTLQSGAVPSNPWSESLYEGVFLTGPLTNESSQYWYIGGKNTSGLQSVKVDFGDTPLYVRKPLVKTQYTAASSQTLYKYTTHIDTGIKECEIYACVENVTFNSSWGSLYEGALGSYSFKSGFFTSEPEIHLKMLNTVTVDESGGIACFIETGIKPTTTSTGTLYAVRPNTGATAKKIRFKIHAKEV